MANTSRLRGFRPVKHLNGSPYNGQVSIYEIGASDTAPVFVGDLMKASDEAATDYYPTAERAGTSGEVTSGLLLGAVVGFVVPTTVGTLLDVPIYRAASTKRFVLIADATDLVFEVEDGATVVTPIASIGLNTGFQATAGDTTTGLSKMTTGNTAATTSSALPLQIMGIANRPDNDPAATSQKLLVRINQHQYMGGQTAV